MLLYLNFQYRIFKIWVGALSLPYSHSVWDRLHTPTTLNRTRGYRKWTDAWTDGWMESFKYKSFVPENLYSSVTRCNKSLLLIHCHAYFLKLRRIQNKFTLWLNLIGSIHIKICNFSSSDFKWDWEDHYMSTWANQMPPFPFSADLQPGSVWCHGVNVAVHSGSCYQRGWMACRANVKVMYLGQIQVGIRIRC